MSSIEYQKQRLDEELRSIPDWIGYINGHLNPDHYTTDGMPRTRFKAFSSATSYQLN